MHFFARNAQTASEIGDLKVGITQIDPRGSYGPKKSDASEYRAVRPLDFSLNVGGDKEENFNGHLDNSIQQN